MSRHPPSGRGQGALRLAFGLVATLIPAAPAAQAGVVVHATRVIYPAQRKEVTVDLRNEGEGPALVQAWIDAGDPPAGQPAAEAPFALSPAIFRLDPASGQSLRILYTGKPLPTDRETVFWLNVLDIPPKAKPNPDAPNRLDFAFRHRMKLFFRPAQIRGKAELAAGQVGWTLRSGPGGPSLIADNPTPFHVSLVRLELAGAGSSQPASAQATTPAMLEPMSSAAFALKGGIPAGAVRVRYGFIDDYGAMREGEATLRSGSPGS